MTHLGNGDALKPARAHGQIREVVDANAWVAGWRLKLWGLRRSEVLGFELGRARSIWTAVMQSSTA